MINLNHLRSFYVCALHKNMTNAAKSLNVTQPSLSQQIKIFEEEVGFELFFRNGRTLDLTPKGVGLFRRTEPIFNSVSGVTDFLMNQLPVERSIAIAVSEQIERPFVSKLTSQLMRDSIFKSSKFKIISDDVLKLKSRFREKEFNLFLSHQEIKNMKPIKSFEFPVKLVSSRTSHALSTLSQKSLPNLLKGLGEKLVLPSEGLQLRTEINSFFEKSKLDLDVIFESNILACITEAVRNQVGCGFLPVAYVYDEIKKNKLSIFGPEGGFWKHKVFLYSLEKQERIIADEFIRAMQNFTLQNGG
jgi:DNA-binding transcriptional LysR family regulator